MNVHLRNLVAATLVGLVLGAVLTFLVMSREPKIEVKEGRAFANHDGSAIGFRSGDAETEDGYSLLPEQKGGDSSLPTCIEPLKTTPVRIGTVHIAPKGDISGREVLVWIECLGPSEAK
jgi:hypothetical protein